MKKIGYLVYFVAFSAVALFFQNCGDVKVIGSESLEVMTTDCSHPTGSYPSDPNTRVQFFKESNVCSNLSESCQSAFFRCENRAWTADVQNPNEDIRFFPYKSCVSYYCDENPQPPCPEPMPQFNCEEWGAWSDSVNSCGTRTKVCTRTLPVGCNFSTTDTQTETKSCDSGSVSQYPNLKEHVDACGGSYKFEHFPNQTDPREMTFKLKDQISGLYVNPEDWKSSTNQISKYPALSEAKVTLRAYSCELFTIEAHFKDKCGDPVVLGHIYTMDGCPPPNPNIVTGAGDVIIPEDTNGVLTRAKSIKIGIGEYMSTPGQLVTRNVEKVVSAFYGTTFSGNNPVVTDRNWFAQGAAPYALQIPKGTYISMEFTTPVTDKQLSLFVVWEQPVEGGGPVSVSFSQYPGDFYLGRDSKNCLADQAGYGGMSVAINANGKLPNACNLVAGQKYFINVTGARLPGGTYTSSKPHTTWLLGHFDMLDFTTGNLFEPIYD